MKTTLLLQTLAATLLGGSIAHPVEDVNQTLARRCTYAADWKSGYAPPDWCGYEKEPANGAAVANAAGQDLYVTAGLKRGWSIAQTVVGAAQMIAAAAALGPEIVAIEGAAVELPAAITSAADLAKYVSFAYKVGKTANGVSPTKAYGMINAFKQNAIRIPPRESAEVAEQTLGSILTLSGIADIFGAETFEIIVLGDKTGQVATLSSTARESWNVHPDKIFGPITRYGVGDEWKTPAGTPTQPWPMPGEYKGN